MTHAIQPASAPPAAGPSGSSFADVIDTILDKGLVIDAQIGVSVIGIELLSIDARAVISSIDTYLRFADAVSRLGREQSQRTDQRRAIEGTTRDTALGRVGDILGEIVDTSADQEHRQRGR